MASTTSDIYSSTSCSVSPFQSVLPCEVEIWLRPIWRIWFLFNISLQGWPRAGCVPLAHHLILRLQSWTSVAVLAEISLRSPRKLFIFIIKKIIYRIKISKNKFISFWKKLHCHGLVFEMWARWASGGLQRSIFVSLYILGQFQYQRIQHPCIYFVIQFAE